MTVQSKLGPVFGACKQDDRAALIGYLPTGYPDVQTSIDAMTALVDAGCDLIEVGIASVEAVFDWRAFVRDLRGEETI